MNHKSVYISRTGQGLVRPYVIVKFDNVEDLNLLRSSLSATMSEGRAKVGSIPKNNPLCLILSGLSAIKACELLEVGIPGFFTKWCAGRKRAGKFDRFLVTDEMITADTLQFKTRTQWKVHGKHYRHCNLYRKEDLERFTAHMDAPCGPYRSGYEIYAYEFSDNCVYAGLTCRSKSRARDHKDEGPVNEHSAKTGLVPNKIVLESGLGPDQARIAEIQAIKHYRASGWTVLNKRDGGELGGYKRPKYDYAKVLDMARSSGADCVSQFYRLSPECDGAYTWCLRNAMIDRLKKDMGWPDHRDHKWTKEKVIAEASKYSSVKEWLKANAASYGAAQNLGLLKFIRKNIVVGFRPSVAKRVWTVDECLARASCFKSRTEWQYKCGDSSYLAARRSGFLPEIYTRLGMARKSAWTARRLKASVQQPA